MAIKIRPVTEISEKWVRRASGATEEYASGVANPKKDWAIETKDAEAAYKAGVTAAAAAGRFGKGVAKAGTGKWKKGAEEKGVARFGPGVSVGKENHASGFGPYASTIAGVALPPRGPKGDPRNIERVRTIAAALRAKKIAA